MSDAHQQQSRALIEQVAAAVERQDESAVHELLHDVPPADIADILEAFPGDDRAFLFQSISDLPLAEVLLEMSDIAAASLVDVVDADTLVSATDEMDTTDLAELLDTLPDQTTEDILDAMDSQRRSRVQASLAYEDDTAGRLMHTDTISVRSDVSLETVQRYLRMLENVPPDTDVLMVVDRDNQYEGQVTVLDLLRNPLDARVADVMNRKTITLQPEMSESHVAQIFEAHDFITAPVVNAEGYLLGRIVIDDIVDVIREEADHAVLSQAGLSEEEDLFAPVIASARRRAVWLGINLLTALLAAWVIGLFEATLDQIVALAVLMPVVASMGGIAGSQTLTLTIRGLALGQVTASNTRWLFRKELAIGGFNGVLWSLIVAGIAVLWFNSVPIGAVIAAALIINLIAAAFAGIAVPITLNKLKIDPALSGAVILTTVTDVIGFLSFLGLATLFLV